MLFIVGGTVIGGAVGALTAASNPLTRIFAKIESTKVNANDTAQRKRIYWVYIRRAAFTGLLVGSVLGMSYGACLNYFDQRITACNSELYKVRNRLNGVINSR